MRRRGLAITLAVLLALLGTAGVLVYVNQANTRALAGQKAVTVLIAKQFIPAGTSAGDAQDNGLLGTEKLPAESVPASALAAVTPGLRALVTDSVLQPGQLLLRPMLVTSAQVSAGFAIPAGMIAVSVLFCMPEAVAGNIHPGSQIAVFNTTVSSTSGNSANAGMSASAACNGPHQTTPGVTVSTRLVLPRVTVLSVGTASASAQGGSQGGSQSGGTASASDTGSQLLTVAVSQNDAERLIQLAQDGLPYLALVNDGSHVSVTAGASSQGG